MRFPKLSVLVFCASAAVLAQPRLDMLVRNDFFAGFAGDQQALDRGMKKCEELLATEPRNAEAMVWHGSGVFYRSGVAARANDLPKAAELYKKGLDEMAAAVALQPDNISVVIPRGAALLTGSEHMPGDRAKSLIQTGVGDYENVYKLQSAYFDKLNGHARSELLFGLAYGYQRLGDSARAREWYEKLAAVSDPENGHREQAKSYLATGQISARTTCVGCHVSK
jgi:tetratricopeptide (TPR) repeat protein